MDAIMGKKSRPEVLRKKGGGQRGRKVMDCATYRSEIMDKNTPLMDGRHNDGINGFDTLVRQCGPCGKKLCASMHGSYSDFDRHCCLKPVCPGNSWDRRKVQ